MSCDISSLQDLCADLHQKIGVVDEARYDIESKVARNEKEVNLKSPTSSSQTCCGHVIMVLNERPFGVAQIISLNQKIVELKGIKKPNLRRVKKTTDDMLGACTDTSRLMKADFKANLKTVKKEDEKVKGVTEEKAEVLEDGRHGEEGVEKDEEEEVSNSKKPSKFPEKTFLLFWQREEVTDWRKNVEAMSGMEGRKKLFNAGQ